MTKIDGSLSGVQSHKFPLQAYEDETPANGGRKLKRSRGKDFPEPAPSVPVGKVYSLVIEEDYCLHGRASRFSVSLY